MIKENAINVSEFFSGGVHGVGQHDAMVGWGALDGTTPTVYQEIWYKFLLPNFYESYNVTVYNIGGGFYVPYPPLDDEIMPQPPVWPGEQYPCNVTMYDTNDAVMASGEHIQFTSQGRFNTWVYFKVTQPAPHYPGNIQCYERFKIRRMDRAHVDPGYCMVQGTNKIAAITSPWLGAGEVRNYVFPELTGHSVGGTCGDILLTGVNCIQDTVAGGISVRTKRYLAAVTFAFAPGTVIHNITGNADRINDFWVSYTESGVHKCRAVKILNEGAQDYMPVNAQLGPVMGITAQVKVLQGRLDQVLYYVEEGTNVVKMWDIANNVFIRDFYGDPGFGNITDLRVVPGGDLLIGYNGQVYPTTYTIRRFNGLDGTHIRDYSFVTNNYYNRMNYTNDNGLICLWTHDVLGKSTFRKIRLNDGVVGYSFTMKEFENDAMVIVDDIYHVYNPAQPTIPAGNPIDPAQFHGPAQGFNFWISPVFVRDNSNATNGEGILFTQYNLTAPPDDEYYPPYFPPYAPDGGFIPNIPPEDEQLPYPGYPWLPPPPVLPGDPPLKPPNVVPLPVRIGGGLIILDPTNPNRTDVYQSTEGLTLSVPIKMNIRTAFIGD